MNELTTDRSGRTLKDYRELYWAEKKRRKEDRATIERVEKEVERLESLPEPHVYAHGIAYKFRKALADKPEE